MRNLSVVAEQFKPQGKIIDIREFGNGNINDTFLITLDAGEERRFVLQRINTHVFPQPELVMRNMRIATGHILRRLERVPLIGGRRWRVPRVLLTQDSRDHWIDSGGSFWRAVSFIENAQSFDTLKDINHAKEAGLALGMFHSFLSDLPCESLSDTLKGFHITPLYLKHYDEVSGKYSGVGSPELNYCFRFISERSSWAHVLENAKEQGRLLLRPIHGDPKAGNILMDIVTGQAVGIVDLDTVKPGLIHYDIGDCLRSGCNPMGEETEQPETVYFDTDICRAVLQGYLSASREFLTENDFSYIYDSIRLIAFELGLRFFTDYMEGNVYFKVQHMEHNLARAIIQFRLCESIESQEAAIRNIIADLG